MCQTMKISTSGQALGSSLLFRSRLAFSGTPSDLLPREGDFSKQLYPCVFEKGSEGKMLHTLSYDKNVTAWLTEAEWSVESLLLHIAHDDTPEHRVDALIDTGALITGKSNLQTAQFLLDHGLSWAAGCVFLDDDDQKMVLLRAGKEGEAGRVVREAQCGLAWHKRFSFYDNVHTTGMDIKQHPKAVAVLTIGKDMTFRDYAQGAYRMRGLAKGQPQTIQLYIVPEVRGLVLSQVDAQSPSSDAAASGSERASTMTRTGRMTGSMTLLPNSDVKAIVAWLLLNSIRLESKQMMQLAVQNCDGVYRRLALEKMLASPTQASGAEKAEATLALTEAFIEPVDVALPTIVPVSKSFVTKMNEKCAANEAVVKSDAVGKACVQEMLDLVEEVTSSAKAASKKKGKGKGGGGSADAWGENDLDSTQTQEREQQVEQEKQKQREVEKEAMGWKSTQRDHDDPIAWNVADLVLLGNSDAFFPVADFKLKEASQRSDAAAAAAENSAGGQPKLLDGAANRGASVALLSSNFTSHAFTSPLERRLRSLQTMIVVKASTNTSGVIALNLFETATLRRAMAEAQRGKGGDALANCVLHTVDGAVIARGVKVNVAEESDLDEKVQGPMQLLRFFDCATTYEDFESAVLLSTLSPVPMEQRKRFFTETVKCKRRDDPSWEDTDVSLIFQLKDRAELDALEQIKKSVNAALQAQGRSIAEMCADIDIDNDASLDLDEIIKFFSTKEMQSAGMPPPMELKALKRALKAKCDLNGDSSISYDEMQRAFQGGRGGGGGGSSSSSSSSSSGGGSGRTAKSRTAKKMVHTLEEKLAGADAVKVEALNALQMKYSRREKKYQAALDKFKRAYKLEKRGHALDHREVLHQNEILRDAAPALEDALAGIAREHGSKKFATEGAVHTKLLEKAHDWKQLATLMKKLQKVWPSGQWDLDLIKYSCDKWGVQQGWTLPVPKAAKKPTAKAAAAKPKSKPKAAADGDAEAAAVVQARIVGLFVALKKPTKIKQVPDLMKRFRGKEAKLIASLEKRFGCALPPIEEVALHERLIAYFQINKPSKVDVVDKVMKKVPNEAKLRALLHKKYGSHVV